MYIAHWNAPYT